MAGDRDLQLLYRIETRWCHDIETISTLLALCVRTTHHWWISLQGPVIRSFDIFFTVCLSKQSICSWLETPWHSCAVIVRGPYGFSGQDFNGLISFIGSETSWHSMDIKEFVWSRTWPAVYKIIYKCVILYWVISVRRYDYIKNT